MIHTPRLVDALIKAMDDDHIGTRDWTPSSVCGSQRIESSTSVEVQT